MRRIRTVAVLPTLFTLGNLVCGFFAIVVASRIPAPQSPDIPVATSIQFRASPMSIVKQFDVENPTHNAMLAGWLIFLAMVFDALDGHVARLAKVASDFGAQLDSLCDAVTFGVAPAILLVKICPATAFLHHEAQHEAIWIIATSFAACALLRLARFNVETGEEDDHLRFSGLPSPAAAGTIASFAIMFYSLRRAESGIPAAADIDLWIQRGLPLVGLALAALMVSRIPYPHIVNQMFRGQRSFGHVVGIVFMIVVVATFRGLALPFICCGFAFIPPLIFLWTRIRDRGRSREPIF